MPPVPAWNPRSGIFPWISVSGVRNRHFRSGEAQAGPPPGLAAAGSSLAIVPSAPAAAGCSGPRPAPPPEDVTPPGPPLRGHRPKIGPRPPPPGSTGDAAMPAPAAPRRLGAAAPAGKAKLTHPGKAILAGKHPPGGAAASGVGIRAGWGLPPAAPEAARAPRQLRPRRDRPLPPCRGSPRRRSLGCPAPAVVLGRRPTSERGFPLAAAKGAAAGVSRAWVSSSRAPAAPGRGGGVLWGCSCNLWPRREGVGVLATVTQGKDGACGSRVVYRD